MVIRTASTVLLAALSHGVLVGQDFPFRNASLPVESRVEDLVSRMTLEEKCGQMLYNAPAIERLGIPAYNWWNEALHGVARAGVATVFPQAIGLAATWDSDLLFRVATAISDEARAKHHESIRQGRVSIYEGLTFWSPNINIFRDPRWGRGMETYGEDPYLTGILATAFVKGMQGDDPKYLKTIATPKHFAVHSGPEPDRHRFDARVSERDLRETYLPAFRTTILDGNAQSIMCAYNRFRGDACCGSSELLQKILRDEWGFTGYVVSDCWAIMDFVDSHKIATTVPAAAAMALSAGTDLNCGVAYDSLAAAVRRGLVSERQVDTAVRRLFTARFRLGMFDPPEMVAYARIPYSANDSRANQALALEAARKSIVLLKNNGGVLPLSKSLHRIAVIGPNADDVDVLLGNYNGLPSRAVTPLQGIRDKVGKRTVVEYERGSDVAEGIRSLKPVPGSVLVRSLAKKPSPGLRGEYFSNWSFRGGATVDRTDSTVNFEWMQKPSAPNVRADSFSVRWSGFLRPKENGPYELGTRVFGDVKFFLSDTLFLEYSDRHVAQTASRTVRLEAGRSYSLRLEFKDRRADALCQLVWAPPNDGERERALMAVKRSDVVVLVMGLSPRLEGEEMPVKVDGFSGGDRTSLDLPAGQRELMQAIAGTGKPVVLVLLNGSAIGLRWAGDNLPAIVEAWYPGQATGTALADVLFGDENPAGRLPVTFYEDAAQLPPFSEYSMEGRTYRYFGGRPVFRFGDGIGYSRFAYSNPTVPDSVVCGTAMKIRVDVKNMGRVDGDEVVQLYIRHLSAPVPVPLRSLQGFKRIHLKKGETRSMQFTLTPRQLSFVDDLGLRIVEPGGYEVSVGGSQPSDVVRVQADDGTHATGRFMLVGSRRIIQEREE